MSDSAAYVDATGIKYRYNVIVVVNLLSHLDFGGLKGNVNHCKKNRFYIFSHFTEMSAPFLLRESTERLDRKS